MRAVNIFLGDCTHNPSRWGREKWILLVLIHSSLGLYVLQIHARFELIRLVVDNGVDLHAKHTY